jgi:hypothetical protein
MSAKSRKKARRHKKRAMTMICQKCGDVRPAAPGALLTGLADAMNACGDAGITVRLRHGVVMTRHGYVLPVAGAWTARTLAYDPFLAPPVPALDDGMDD